MTLVECRACGSELGMRPLAWLVLLVGITAAGMAHSTPSSGSTSAPNAPKSELVDKQATAVAALQITEVNWHKGGFNNIMMLNAAVQNSGESNAQRYPSRVRSPVRWRHENRQ